MEACIAITMTLRNFTYLETKITVQIMLFFGHSASVRYKGETASSGLSFILVFNALYLMEM